MTQAEFTARLGAHLEEMGIIVSGECIKKLHRYHTMVYAANEKLKLTAIYEEDAPLLNIADSLSALPLVGEAKTVCDVGSGAGLPGIAMSLAKPGTAFTLMDSLKRRVSFLSEVIGELKLENVRAVHIRAEDAGRDPFYRECFDAAVARALAPMPVLCEYLLPLLRIGGRMIAFKGVGAEEEIKAARKALDMLGGGGVAAVPAKVPGRMHVLVTAKKIRPTPNAYPRRAGTPPKSPIT